MLEKRLFTQGMNSDDEDRFVKEGEYTYALNIRAGVSDGDNHGAIENAKGNTLVDFQLPAGQNQVVGSIDDKKNRRVIYFIWNSFNNHSILEYSSQRNEVTQVLKGVGLELTGNPITGVNIIDDKILNWVDYGVEPKQINIELAKEGYYDSVPDSFQINAIAPYYNIAPKTFFITNNSKNYNNLKNAIWQFRVQLEYADAKRSSWSPITNVQLSKVVSYRTGENKDNGLSIQMWSYSKYVKKIRLAAKSNYGDWQLVEVIDKEKESINNNASFSYEFYNDKAPVALDQNEVNQLFSWIPRSANSQELIDGNRIAYGNILEGYDLPNIDASVRPIISSYQEGNLIPSTEQEPIVSISPFFLSFGQKIYIETDEELKSGTEYVFSIEARYVLKVNGVESVLTNLSKEYIAVASGDGNRSSIYISIAEQINNDSDLVNGSDRIISGLTDDLSNSTLEGQTDVEGVHIFTINTVKSGITAGTGWVIDSIIVSASIIDTGTELRKTFKKNSSYDLAIAYYDEYGRVTTAIYKPSLTMNVPLYQDGAGYVDAEVTLNHEPPIWAKTYQILSSENNSIQDFLVTTIGNVAINGRKLTITLDTIPTYNDTNDAILSYGFSKGDRLRVIQNHDSGNLINGEVYGRLDTNADVEILSYDSETQKLEVENNEGTFLTEIKQGTLVELYTPKLGTDSDEKLFYETGRHYNIKTDSSGFRYHDTGATPGIQTPETFGNQNQTTTQPAVIRVNGGDTYWITRRMIGQGNQEYGFNLESDSFSDYFISNFWDKGRPNRVDDSFREIQRPATIRYTLPYVPDSNINGLSIIYDLNFEEYDKRYGSIQRLYSEDKTLICFQELKVGKILVNELVYNDLRGGQSVGASSQILSDMVYYNGEWGIGKNPESFAVYGTNKYFTDVARGAVLRLAANGLFPISEYKQHNFFSDQFRELYESDSIILGTYDERFSEYVMSMSQKEELLPKAEYIISRGITQNEFDSFFEPGDSGANSVSRDIVSQSTIDEIDPSYMNFINAPFVYYTWQELIFDIGYLSEISESVRELNGYSYLDQDLILFVNGVEYFLRGGQQIIIDEDKIRLVLYAERGEDIFSVNDDIRYGTPKEITFETKTISFSEKMGKWSSFWSYIPEWMEENGADMLSFKDGKIYTHNTNDTRNEFYGIKYDSEVEFVSNNSPSNTKFYKSLQVESNDVWEMPQATNQQGQKTNLIEQDFEKREDHYYAAFLKDENTPNLDLPLIEGDDMRSYTLKVKLRNSNPGNVVLFGAGIKFSPSELSNR